MRPAATVEPAGWARWTRFVSLWGPVLVCMAVIFGFSAQNQPEIPGGLSDKTAHFLGYFGLGMTVARAVAGGIPPARFGARDIAWLLVITIGYGISDEIHQLFVPGRTSDVRDVLADATGAVVAAAASWAWGIISPRSDV